MKTNNEANIWGTLVAACFVASLSIAQDKIADEDLLRMLEKADASEQVSDTVVVPVKPVEEKNPIDNALESIQKAEERVSESELDEAEPIAEVALETDLEDEMIDDLGMEVYEDELASTVGELISVRLNKVGLEEAINLFAQLSGANIIVPELAEASQISVNLKDVEWRPALQSILDVYNYELYQKVSGSNVFSVRRRPVGAPEPQVVETFKLKYATVPNVAALVRELLPADAKVSEFASRNMIVVKSSESSLSEIRSVLSVIDIVRQQVFIESKFMELSDGAQKDLGIDWQVLQGYSAGTVGPVQRSRTDTDSSDKTSSKFTDATGKEYAEGSGFTVPGSLDLITPVYEGLTPGASSLTSKGVSEVLTSVLSVDEFRLVLSALEENKGVNVVSNPKVIVANEEEASISIVRKEPNLKQERTEALNDTPTEISFTLDPEQPFFEYGIKLNVTPSINTSSNITVNITPSLTRKFGDKDAGATTYPIIDEKTIKTVFNLSSGQTAAIGGLTEVSDSEIERKVPVLGSIPFIGRLFSWKQTILDQRETIIFVTVSLANTMEFDIETGLPEDSELARRQLIKDRNKKEMRELGRKYYQAEEADKLDDMLKVIRQKETERQQRRVITLQKEEETSEEGVAKENDVASIK